MKKSIFILFLFSFNLVSLFSIETVIVPKMGYTNYFLHSVYKTRRTSTYLHTVSLGLDLMFLTDKTGFTFFVNNALSFMDEVQAFGDVDFISAKGATVVEGMLWDTSFLAGYTIDCTEDLKLRLGVGMGFFHGIQPRSDTTMTGIGSVFVFHLDYFFVNDLGISFGVEEGVYGSIRKKQLNEKFKFFNRVQTKLGLALKF